MSEARRGKKSLITTWSEPMLRTVKSFVANESGATAIEYALIASLIAVALISILGALGTRLSGEFSQVSAALK